MGMVGASFLGVEVGGYRQTREGENDPRGTGLEPEALVWIRA